MEWKICWKKYFGNGDFLYKLRIIKFLSWPHEIVYVCVYVKFDILHLLDFSRIKFFLIKSVSIYPIMETLRKSQLWIEWKEIAEKD